jgi:hypothetical protein
VEDLWKYSAALSSREEGKTTFEITPVFLFLWNRNTLSDFGVLGVLYELSAATGVTDFVIKSSADHKPTSLVQFLVVDVSNLLMLEEWI